MILRPLTRASLALAQRRSLFTAASCLRSRPSLDSARRQPRRQQQWEQPLPSRTYATSKSLADEKIDEIQEQYATTKDEFEIAVEETEKKTVYAADDRAAAQEELKKLKELFDEAVRDSELDVAKEITTRAGQRIRELDHAIQGLEESARED